MSNVKDFVDSAVKLDNLISELLDASDESSNHREHAFIVATITFKFNIILLAEDKCFTDATYTYVLEETATVDDERIKQYLTSEQYETYSNAINQTIAYLKEIK